MIKIDFNKPFIAGKELFYIARAVIENRHTAGNGPFTKKCDAWLEEHLCCRKALLTHSCTAALEMAAILVDIQPGDEVIMPSFTFVSTANAFVLRGGVPVFIDICSNNLNMDVSLIEDAITEKTRAIVPVHYAGVGCDMEKVLQIANDHGLRVIEDAAQGLLSRYQDQFLGTIGHLGCLSFHETKNIISGEGGALLINDPELTERAEIIWEKGTNRSKFFRGQVDKYTWVDIGSSFLPGELTAAFLFAQLEAAEKINSQRRKIFNLYLDLLRPLERDGKIRLPFVDSESFCNGHIFYILTGNFNERDRLIKYLREKGIMTVFHYVPLHSSPAGIKYGRKGGSLKVTDKMSNCVLRLPMYYEMSEEDVVTVTDELNIFFKNE
ncbi:MAG: dTDP-4-amino-4,6-dideoxygalactose transaminase [Deltaproteobacteria bacterium HGW-Deltaproteobacteria-1]|jgi:dTDP-4-amino-4,6-dideoxygalactose transaminase|nr:MAG: dTDP-4-amino-4,6-dideoxygalactose transaminase [Deltaproteobacteria bacterium HGW-Deltaproteobacteria-1]